MPIVAVAVDKCKIVEDYKNSLDKKLIPMDSYLIQYKPNQYILLVIYPILSIFELRMFNPIFRSMLKRGLKKCAYFDTFTTFYPVKTLELIKVLTNRV
jgi:hypothetical protein